MKRLLSVAVIAAISTTLYFSSCTKKNDNPVGNYTCTCIVAVSGSSADTVVLPENNIAKNTAQASCTQAQTTYQTGGNTATCTFK